MLKKFLIILLFISQSCFGQPSVSNNSALRVNLGFFYSTRNIYRGALIWDAPIVAVAPSFVFYNSISLGQGGLTYFNKFDELQTFTIGLSAFNDNKPSFPAIRLKNDQLDYKNLRHSSIEPYIKYDLRLKQFFAFSTSYHKEIKEHYGNYFYLRLSTSIIPLITFGQAYGYGDSKHNKYLYGPSGVIGRSHSEKFASLMIPFLPWQGRLMFNYNKTKIIKNANVNADYIRGKRFNENFSLALMWSL